MTRKVQFYTIAFENEDRQVCDLSVSDYLNRLENEIISKKTSSSMHISDKKMNIFKYNRPISGARDEMVIPFGFMKSNTPYVEDQSDDFIATPSTDKLYDVNLLYYNEKDKIAILTLFKGAPSSKRICEFLNSYIPDSEFKIKIRPLFNHTSIDTIRCSEEVKSIELSLNLDEDIEYYFNSKIKQTEAAHSTMLQGIELMSKSSKGLLDNSNFKISLGLGRNGKKTMNIDNVYELLNVLDIDDDFVKEITVKYKYRKEDELSIARIKNADIELKANLNYDSTSVELSTILLEKASELIESNLDAILERKRNYYKNPLLSNEPLTISNLPSLTGGDKFGNEEQPI